MQIIHLLYYRFNGYNFKEFKWKYNQGSFKLYKPPSRFIIQANVCRHIGVMRQFSVQLKAKIGGAKKASQWEADLRWK